MIAWWQSGTSSFLWGALLMIANWPWTLIGIAPTNNRLMVTSPDAAGPNSRALIIRWGHLHAVRTVMGGLATLCFLFGLAH
jgi:hypothetical protein